MNSQSKSFYNSIQLIEPPFGSPLTDLIIDLDYLRRKKVSGTTHPKIFFQLKNLFHTLESIGSARIEGNHTTIAEFIETKLSSEKNIGEDISEIMNVERAMNFIDDTIDDNEINEAYIRELHKYVVTGLSASKEGDITPGRYRSYNVKITKSTHTPPENHRVCDYMEELTQFISRKDPPKYDLLKIALTHHRFAWIHPFGNGNGRTVRLLTYAQLVKYGFNIHIGHIVNPTAIFCIDRNSYYDNLTAADDGSEKGLLNWSQYVLSGLKGEVEKIDKLLDYSYLAEAILLPSITDALEHKVITAEEAAILKVAVAKQAFMAGDLEAIFPDKHAPHISRALSRLKDKKMIIPEEENKRKYILAFENNYLIRSIITMLDKNNFLPLKGEV
ncbi:MAG: Fic family protein [Candidatus Roizmanbacteria bacterium]